MLRNINIPIHNISAAIIYHLTLLEFHVLNSQFDVLSLVISLIKHFLVVDLNTLIKRSLPLSPYHSR